jgi:hypothetical protein
MFARFGITVLVMGGLWFSAGEQGWAGDFFGWVGKRSLWSAFILLFFFPPFLIFEGSLIVLLKGINKLTFCRGGVAGIGAA